MLCLPAWPMPNLQQQMDDAHAHVSSKSDCYLLMLQEKSGMNRGKKGLIQIFLPNSLRLM